MRASNVVSALVAVVVGFGGTVALIITAADSTGASHAQTISWIVAVCLGTAASSLILSARFRMPIIAAWSTPGSALIAAYGIGDIHLAVGAFLVSAVLLTAAGVVPRLNDLLARIPSELAAGMLAGILVQFVTRAFSGADAAPRLVLPLIVLFLVVRAWRPVWPVVSVLAAGVPLSVALGYDLAWPKDVGVSRMTWIEPHFSLATVIGLGIPLFIVTMASQNLPGLAVLRSFGYRPHARPLLMTTGIASLLTAPFGAHATNLAAVVASVGAGEESHPDPDQRWKTGVVYGALYVVVAAFAGLLVALLTTLPIALVNLVAGLALVSPLVGALTAAVDRPDRRFAAVLAFAVTASGLTLVQVGSAFWGLATGLMVLGIDRLAASRRPPT